MAIVKEFKEFAMRGNVIDLAVAVVIGGAFGKIVSSLVTDVIMPPIGLLTGGIDFSDLKIKLKNADALKKLPEVDIHYGLFLNAVIQFLIIAFAIFLVVKGINSLKKTEAPAEVVVVPDPLPTKEEILLTQIRDILAGGKTIL